MTTDPQAAAWPEETAEAERERLIAERDAALADAKEAHEMLHRFRCSVWLALSSLDGEQKLAKYRKQPKLVRSQS